MRAGLLAVVLAGCAAPAVTNDGGAPTDAGSANDAGASTDAGALLDAGAGVFLLTSPDFVDGGTLPVEFTCDGVGHSPPLAWSGAPAGTTQFAVMMTTFAPNGEKWNWVLYALPASVSALAVATDAGIAGLTSDGPLLAYSPPCSQGPGPKAYTFTVYALSGAPSLPSVPSQVTGPVLTQALTPLELASSSLTVTYAR